MPSAVQGTLPGARGGCPLAYDDVDLAILEYGYQGYDGRLRSSLEFTLEVAQLAELSGYSRIWFTEHHHDRMQIAAPEVMIATVAARTRRIRVGSAGILLGYYSPWKVAEVFHTLSTLFPDRIDLGIARGMGASPEVAERLRDGAAAPPNPSGFDELFTRKTEDLARHLRTAFDCQQRIESTAQLVSTPELWVMGAGTASAQLAAKVGAKFALWYQRQELVDTQAVMGCYTNSFRPTPDGSQAAGCLSMVGICAETDTEARALLNAAVERSKWPVTVDFCGCPERCRDIILTEAARHSVREVVVRGLHGEPDQAKRTYQLLAEVLLRDRPEKMK